MADLPTWAQQARTTATHNLQTLPALTGEEEDWRFTPPASLGLDANEPSAAAAAGSAVSPPEDGRRSARLVLADATPGVPQLGALPEGVIVAELGQALIDHEDLVRTHLYSLIGFDDRPGALNAASWQAGTFVYVPRGVHLELPSETLLSVSGASAHVHARTLVVVDEGARATVVDRYASPPPRWPCPRPPSWWCCPAASWSTSASWSGAPVCATTPASPPPRTRTRGCGRWW
ncbi:MAG: hypothetical protein U0Y82_03340 [Thermoleophilia bacterium]